MRLKALEMQGFKSFPDKTVLSFDQGITGIVGPNGSGKSNITDAVRWVLGEMSTKSVRGSKMEDVIFGGSDNRRPMGYAEVSLVIDNTTGIGHLESEYDEVTVTRRYFRGGESEYRINGRTVRLRDIAELFMNTGVGKTGYSNIGQGKISEIVSQKSDDRRSVFEEAAGISKYRFRKNEAERKLKDTEDNLLRLTDILSELEARVGPLQKEAAAAKKYLDLYEQKKEVDVSLWLYDAENMRAKANETERQYVASKLALEGVDGEIAALEQRSELLYQKASENQTGAEELADKIRQTTSRRQGMEGSLRVLENDILHTDVRISQTENELTARRLSLAEGERRAEELKRESEEAKKKLDALCLEISGVEKKKAELEEACRAAEEAILAREREEKVCEEELLTLRVRLSALEGTHSADSGRSEGLEEEISSATLTLATLSDGLKRTEASLASYREAIDAEKARGEGIKGKISSCEEKLLSEKEKLNSLTLSVEAKRQKADALQRMDDLFEGYHYSVKNVMKGVSDGLLSRICGPVSRLLTVPPAYGIAVETALGANLQNIVTEDEEAAKAAISYLKRTNGGRATFYPITSVKAGAPAVSPSELGKKKGYIGMADRLCRFEKKYEGVIGYLLGRTAVFDTLDSAAEAAKSFGYRIRIVTTDGQLINAGGSFTGGSVKSDSGILTRASEISAIRAEISSLSEDKRKLEEKIAEENRRLAELREQGEESGEKLALLNTLYQAEQTQAEVSRSRAESEQARLEALKADRAGLGQQYENYDREHKALSGEIEATSGKLEEAKARTAAAVASRNRADEEADKENEAYNSLRIEKTVAEKDVEALAGSRALNDSTLTALREQISRGEELISELTEKKSSAQKSISENQQSSVALAAEIEALEKERKGRIDRGLEFEKEQSKIREELRDGNHRREVIFREYTKLEGKREQITAEHDRLAAKIWEDYELTYTTAAELGYPPVTADTRASYGSRQTELKNKIRALGPVNVGAIEEYAEVKQRYDFSKGQFDDLTKAKESLGGIIGRLEQEMKTKFLSAVSEINKNFKVTFRELFGGGNAEISLTDPENVLGSGIEINVAPPGKIINNLISLSGGEQAFVAIALIFAILNVNPTPFCIFDEIESALDEVNVVRLAEYMRRYSEKTQFVAITHRRGTMENADMLYGITMPDRGISKVLKMNVNEVEQKLGGNYH